MRLPLLLPPIVSAWPQSAAGDFGGCCANVMAGDFVGSWWCLCCFLHLVIVTASVRQCICIYVCVCVRVYDDAVASPAHTASALQRYHFLLVRQTQQQRRRRRRQERANFWIVELYFTFILFTFIIIYYLFSPISLFSLPFFWTPLVLHLTFFCVPPPMPLRVNMPWVLWAICDVLIDRSARDIHKLVIYCIWQHVCYVFRPDCCRPLAVAVADLQTCSDLQRLAETCNLLPSSVLLSF